MSRRPIPTHLSIHDVMPETLDKVLAIIERLESKKLCPIYLLVVPGCDWSDAQLQSLHELTKRGHILAGHGWKHQVEDIRDIKHRIHSRFISRNVAEHLALDAGGITDLIRRNHAWFAEHDFDPPELYVPPAWAMGAIPRATLRTLPFRYYEYLSGIYDAKHDQLRRLPVIGYEADIATRGFLLRLSNIFNLTMQRTQRLPLRLAIHPHDFDILLTNDLHSFLSRKLEPLSLQKVMSGNNA